MKRVFALIALLLVTAVAVTAQTRTVGPKADCDAIIELLAVTYVEAGNRGDPDLRMSLWDRESIRYMPDLSILDLEGMTKRTRANMAANTNQMWVKVDEVMVWGDFAYATGPYGSKATAKATGKVTEAAGRYLEIFRKQPDGSWKIYRDLTAVVSK